MKAASVVQEKELPEAIQLELCADEISTFNTDEAIAIMKGIAVE